LIYAYQNISLSGHSGIDVFFVLGARNSPRPKDPLRVANPD
jgi:hypothetical protein